MSREVIVMIGFPGSGKTTLAKEKSNEGYCRIDGDVLKTAKAMIKEAEKKIQTQSILFDCTGGTKKKRSEFIAFAKKQKVPVRAFWVQTSLEESMRRNQLREKPVPPVALYVYKKHFEEPSLEEGFSEILSF